MLSNYRVMYLRDQSGQPQGCVAIKLHRNATKPYAEYQFSVVNPADRSTQDPFNRALARQLALGRVLENPFTVRLPHAEVDMHEVSMAVMTDLALYEDAPVRARKAAALWISNAKKKALYLSPWTR
jgi:hypothetical protein